MQISRAAALVLALAVTAPVAAIAGDTGSHADKLSTAVKAHLERMEAARDDKRQAIEALQGLIEQKAPDTALLAQIKVVGASGDREAQQQQLVTDVAKFLTPTEQAKLIVALPEVMKDAMRLVREARKDRE